MISNVTSITCEYRFTLYDVFMTEFTYILTYVLKPFTNPKCAVKPNTSDHISIER